MQRQKIFKTILTILAAAVGIWLFAAVLLPLTLPFALAFLLALVTEPAALWLMEKGKFPRWAAGAMTTLGAYALLFGSLFFLGRWLGRELGGLASELPKVLGNLAGPLGRLEETLVSLSARLPDGLGTAVADMVEDFFHTGAGLMEGLPEKILGWVTAFAKKLPSLALFAVTTVAASFMMAAQLPRLRAWLSRVLPRAWREKITMVWGRVKSATGGWFKAQLKLMGVTFVLVTVGMFFLRVEYPLLAGLGTAVVDALPILGVGTVLIPWAMVLFLRGEAVRGVMFLLLYGITALTRTALEPQLVGRQMGLPPLLTLAAIYIGGRLCGIGGMILFPMGTAVAAQLVKLAKGEG